MMAAEYSIPLPLEVLHGATLKCLHGYVPGFAEYTHDVTDDGLSVFSVFRLSQAQTGDLGEMTLRKASDKTSIINISNPPRPDMNDIDKFWNKKFAKTDREEYKESSKEIRTRKHELNNRRREHQKDVIQAYFSRLVHEVGIWKDNNAYPPDYLIELAGLSPERVSLIFGYGTNKTDRKIPTSAFQFQASASPKVLCDWLVKNTRGVHPIIRNRELLQEYIDGKLRVDIQGLQPLPVMVEKTDEGEVWIQLLDMGQTSQSSTHSVFVIKGAITIHFEGDDERLPTRTIGDVIRIEMWKRQDGCWVTGECSRTEFYDYLYLIGEEMKKAFGDHEVGPVHVEQATSKITEITNNSDMQHSKHLESNHDYNFSRSSFENKVGSGIQVKDFNIGKPEKPKKPKSIKEGGTLDDWFDWYHKMHDNGYKCTLKDVSSEIGYSLGHVKTMHARYMNEGGYNRLND
jgi:hypothetical protein